MKNYPRPAMPVVARDCVTEVHAASAKARAIACSSTEIRSRCGRTNRSNGDDWHSIHGIPLADILAAVTVFKLTH